MGYIGILPSNVRRNSNISFTSRVVYAEITACMDEDLSFTKSNQEVGQLLGISDKVVSGCISELSSRGYIDVQVSGSSRKIYLPEKVVFTEEVQKEKIAPNPDLDKLATAIIAFWKRTFSTKHRVTGKFKSQLKERLKSFSEDEIWDAVRNRVIQMGESDWHNKPENLHHKISLDLVFRNDSTIEKCLNYKSIGNNKIEVQSVKLN